MTQEPGIVSPPVEEASTATEQLRGKPRKRLDGMRANAKGDWTIEDLTMIANAIGVKWHKPSKGSHYIFSSEHVELNLSVPYKRPIKVPYVKLFVRLCDAHLKCNGEDGNHG